MARHFGCFGLSLVILLLVGDALAQAVETSAGWKEGVAAKCRSVKHVPRDDVAYKPGVTHDGWAVAKADLHEPLKIDPDSIITSADLPLGTYVRNPSAYNAPLQEMRMHLGILSMKQGNLYLNDKPLQQDSDAWDAMCRELNGAQ